ncbi:hypothetical protein GN244_ATG03171 [Phytophthora infestans]|uniref:Ubiquitin-like protease family profile domain-containing protein n=1 Tax=Phytophthora infestans TaxID=4787 RepID=A0A833WKL1_PHYIN|nr:hypothetical protein GN244_ATG03171 [Phytophthora infestans]
MLLSVRISDDFILRYVKAWPRDMVCLDQNWFDIKADLVKFLAKETRTTCLSAVDRNLRYGKMVTEIMVKYERAFLDAKYSLRSKRAFLRFREFVGAVSHTDWLTGAVVYYGETAICDGRDGCLVLSSYDLDGHFPAGRNLFSYKLVVMLVGCVPTIAWRGAARISCTYPTQWISQPRQPAGGSCGVTVLALAHTHVRVPTRGFELDTVTAEYIKVLLLRLLWFVMCESLIYPIAHDEEAARVTNEELLEVFPSKLVKKPT